MGKPFDWKINAETIQTIVHCLNEATGDKLKERMHGLKTTNSKNFSFWDILNTDLCSALNTVDCMSYGVKRGAWQMVFLVDPISGHLFTFMREKRFAEIQLTLQKRTHMHYLDILARELNADIVSPVEQTVLYETVFKDESNLKRLASQLFQQLHEDSVVLKNHVLVLFDSDGYMLTSVRAAVVDKNLNIAYEESWSSVISVEEPIIVEKVSEATWIADNPTRGLQLTAKSAARQSKHRLRTAEIDENKRES